jgi:hypothetical protein
MSDLDHYLSTLRRWHLAFDLLKWLAKLDDGPCIHLARLAAVIVSWRMPSGRIVPIVAVLHYCFAKCFQNCLILSSSVHFCMGISELSLLRDWKSTAYTPMVCTELVRARTKCFRRRKYMCIPSRMWYLSSMRRNDSMGRGFPFPLQRDPRVSKSQEALPSGLQKPEIRRDQALPY